MKHIQVVERLVVQALNTIQILIDRWRPSESHHKSLRISIGTTVIFGDQRGGLPIRLGPDDRGRHEYATGSTGSGKTNLLTLLIVADILAGVSVWVIDLRGDLVANIVALIASMPDPTIRERLCLVDFAEDRWLVGLNPLAGSGDAHARALHVLDVIRTQSLSWGVTIEDTLRSALIAIAEAGGSLLDVEPLLTDGTVRAGILSKGCDEFVASFFERYDPLSPERQAGLYGPVLNKLSPILATPRLRACLGSGQPLDIERLFNTPKTIFLVNLAAERFFGASNLMGGLLISSIQAATMARSRIEEKNRIPVHLYVDEFQNFASEAFLSLIAEGRRYRTVCTLAHQNAAQLSRELREVLRSNVHLQYLFQTGNSDASELAPEVTSTERREVVRSLLLSLPRGQTLLIRRGQPTVRVKVHRAPQPTATPEQIGAVRSAALEQFGTRYERSSRRSPGTSEAGSQQGEVRHDKLPNLF